MYICRVVLLVLRQRRGAGLGELQLARGRSKYFATAPAHTQRVLHGAEAREVGVVTSLSFPFGIRARATPAFPVSCAKLPHGVSFVSPLFPALFLPLVLSLKGSSPRDILHMKAGQCDNQMGSKL
jgi:hypothetical protein